MNKNRVELDFCIWGYDDISSEQLTNLIGIVPAKIYVKGEKINPNLLLINKENGWRMHSPLKKKNPSFEEQMNAFYKFMKAKEDVFVSISEKYFCEFSCAIYIYINNKESTPWIHLNEDYRKMIQKLKVEFDIDIILLDNKK